MQNYHLGDHIHWSLSNGNEGEGEIVEVVELPDGTVFYTVKMWLDDYAAPQFETVRDDNVDGLSGAVVARKEAKYNPTGRCIACKAHLADDEDYYLCRVCKYTL
jgi:hypothetical protein